MEAINVLVQRSKCQLSTRHQWLDSSALGGQEEPPEHREQAAEPRGGQVHQDQQGGDARLLDIGRSHQGASQCEPSISLTSCSCQDGGEVGYNTKLHPQPSFRIQGRQKIFYIVMH